MGDFNSKSKSLGYDKLDEFCDLFNLTNLIKSETSFTKNYKSLIGIYTKKQIQVRPALSDYHKLIITFFKTNFSRLRPKIFKLQKL